MDDVLEQIRSNFPRLSVYEKAELDDYLEDEKASEKIWSWGLKGSKKLSKEELLA